MIKVTCVGGCNIAVATPMWPYPPYWTPTTTMATTQTKSK
jgi:hypothetical protein